MLKNNELFKNLFYFYNLSFMKTNSLKYLETNSINTSKKC